MIISSVLFLALVISCGCLYISVRKNLEMMEKLDNIHDVIHEAVITLDSYYKVLEQKSKIELFSDEFIVRELVSDIAAARDAVINVSLVLDNSISYENEEEENKEDGKKE